MGSIKSQGMHQFLIDLIWVDGGKSHGDVHSNSNSSKTHTLVPRDGFDLRALGSTTRQGTKILKMCILPY